MIGGLDRRYVELLPVPTLFARLATIRRVEARRRYNALSDMLTATRGSEEGVQQLSDHLKDVAGVEQDANGWSKLGGLLGGGGA